MTRAMLDNMVSLARSSQVALNLAKVMAGNIANEAVRRSLPPRDLQFIEARIADNRRAAGVFVESYLVTLRRIAESVPRGMVVEQTGLVRADMTAKQLTHFVPYLATIERHLRETQLTQAPTPERARTYIAAAAAEVGRLLQGR
jgi:hypothetical protein